MLGSRRVRTIPPPKPFPSIPNEFLFDIAAINQPRVVIIGGGFGGLNAARGYALADLRMLRFTGFPAWIVWAVVHIYFLIGFANRFFVMLQWLLAFLTKRRQVRVFPGQERCASP